MKIIHLNTSDIEGGAARAAYRLHKGLLQNNQNSLMMVQVKKSDDFTVHAPEGIYQKALAKIRPYIDVIPNLWYRNRMNTPWTISSLSNANVIAKIKKNETDLVHLHWICNNFLSLNDIGKIEQPIIWTLHDSWAFTGGCHIPFDCFRYQEGCGVCQQLGSQCHSDLSNKIWKWKQQVYKKKEITLVAPSQWLAKCAKSSSLFADGHVEVIPNGIDTKVYKPIDKYFARQVLGISLDEKIILFGAMSSTSDYNKGFQYLQPALSRLATIYDKNNIRLLVFGASAPKEDILFPYPVQYTGRLYDEISLTLLYSAADVFVAPSIMDNLPNTVMESLACGTPCVAFYIGGMPDLIDHGENGYLVRPFESEDLAKGIAWILEDDERWKKLSQKARNKVFKNFDINIVANKYINLYEKILELRRNIND